MIKLLTSPQIREADAHTISKKGISSLELMETASRAFLRAFKEEIPDKNVGISIYCGTGNNGGDGLAIARLLKEDGYNRISVKIARFSSKESIDFRANLDRLKLTGISITELTERKKFPKEDANVIIDALIGSGLNKPLNNDLKTLVEYLNKLNRKVIAIDVPGGFPSEGNIEPNTTILKAFLTISFQRPKINFFFPESTHATEHFKVVDIGLDEDFIQAQSGCWNLVGEEDIRGILKSRKAFSHKGNYGHALIIAGKAESMGAALLCADASLHSGAGLTTACIPDSGLTALNIYSPEVMALSRLKARAPKQLEKYSSIAIGPGLGTDENDVQLVKMLLNYKSTPLIFDADALNILSSEPDLLTKIPAMSILCPHIKEFDRMFGEHTSWWDRLETAVKKAGELNMIILLKNRYTFIVTPAGDILINPTGNPAMAVGGMGDVLTGMIAAFLAQKYKPVDAAILATYIHGKAGDELKEKNGMFTIPPRYLIKKIPEILNLYSV